MPRKLTIEEHSVLYGLQPYWTRDDSPRPTRAIVEGHSLQVVLLARYEAYGELYYPQGRTRECPRCHLRARGVHEWIDYGLSYLPKDAQDWWPKKIARVFAHQKRDVAGTYRSWYSLCTECAAARLATYLPGVPYFQDPVRVLATIEAHAIEEHEWPPKVSLFLVTQAGDEQEINTFLSFDSGAGFGAMAPSKLSWGTAYLQELAAYGQPWPTPTPRHIPERFIRKPGDRRALLKHYLLKKTAGAAS